MAKKKVCKKCRFFVDGNDCPVCKGSAFTTNWQGRVFISDPSKSEIGQKIGIEVGGEYAIKCR